MKMSLLSARSSMRRQRTPALERVLAHEMVRARGKFPHRLGRAIRVGHAAGASELLEEAAVSETHLEFPVARKPQHHHAAFSGEVDFDAGIRMVGKKRDREAGDRKRALSLMIVRIRSGFSPSARDGQVGSSESPWK